MYPWSILETEMYVSLQPLLHTPLHEMAKKWIHLKTIYITTSKYVEGGPGREAAEVVWNTNLYI